MTLVSRSRRFRYCLYEAAIALTDLDYIVFYEKADSQIRPSAGDLPSATPREDSGRFLTAMPIWIKEKLYLKDTLKNCLATLAGCKSGRCPPPVHRAPPIACGLGIFPEPFEHDAVLCMDGVGEWGHPPSGRAAAIV